MDNVKAVIFDLDGTLIDSMGIWAQIDEEYLGSFGHAVPENLQEEITHLTLTETANYFKEKFNIKDTLENIISTWHSMALHHYSTTIKLKDNVIPFLNKLKNNGIKIALATSNSTQLLEATLKNNGIYNYFDAISTTEEVKKSKDNPDIYLLSAKKLNITPEECLVFEDIVQAVKGAKLAGMKVYAIHDKSSAHQRDELITLADRYICNYKELL
ncbi:HAD family phosphatase [uncultured Clostridium sp.]|jgi:HAD hydrolase, family IA, variant 3|uniref:HAD family hydrolase n=1 Tax=uncultured Clostridium sp. TaxID=59620 RepID=UPI0025D0C019|nr:HAD family phosphatase [uncultured Clostridium sp.]